MTKKRKICVVVGSRANYSSIKSAMRAIDKHPALELQVIATASAVLDRYGDVSRLMEADGFAIHERVYTLVEGETLATMAKSVGNAMIELPSVFSRLKPDVVLTVGDRFETMATTMAATYMNIPLAHTMGGEVSGNIDEVIRHAITKFANIHFPACDDARERIIKMGEDPSTVHMVGCPRMDIIAELLNKDQNLSDPLFAEGVGAKFDINQPFIMVSQHPVTNDYGQGEQQITQTLQAVLKAHLPALVLWPNADAGSEEVSRGIRKFREHHADAPFHYVKNLPPEIYMPLMAKTACLVGNSSSAIREGAFIGTPSVNIGSRQRNRQRGKNVVDCVADMNAIYTAIQDRLNTGKLASDRIYGDGKAGARIADILSKTPLTIEKTMTY
ncbi:MAG: UDP-N-acetylglucosamine 2-epimerase [Rickettsiales bacterium]|nr:UDP-N-acetylglucosamine 2-epimerase [Rickettsiales bacterium]